LSQQNVKQTNKQKDISSTSFSQTAVHSNHGILFDNKKKWTVVMYKKLDGHNENLLNEKYQTEKAQIVCGSIYIIP
jgi:hypothetical protein